MRKAWQASQAFRCTEHSLASIGLVISLVMGATWSRPKSGVNSFFLLLVVVTFYATGTYSQLDKKPHVREIIRETHLTRVVS